jgi:hypothetical protein
MPVSSTSRIASVPSAQARLQRWLVAKRRPDGALLEVLLEAAGLFRIVLDQKHREGIAVERALRAPRRPARAVYG